MANDWRAYLRAEIDDFRANGGRPTKGPFVGRRLLLLTTVGARSGESRTTPLAYTMDGDRYVIIASKGGSPEHPAWYHNLVAEPAATIEVGTDTIQVRATEVADPAARRRLYDAHGTEHPTFAEYEKRTTREIPVFLVEPVAAA